jgi:hypothetical protein
MMKVLHAPSTMMPFFVSTWRLEEFWVSCAGDKVEQFSIKGDTFWFTRIYGAEVSVQTKPFGFPSTCVVWFGVCGFIKN